MELLTGKTMTDENIKKITGLIKKVLIEFQKEKSFSFSKLVTYQEFKDDIYNFIISIMYNFLDDYDFSNDKCTVIIEKLPKKNKGYFLDNQKYDNLLVINEEVIKSIYDGHIEDFLIIFHELNHFKVKYDIKSGIINDDITRIIKEKLIRTSKDIYSFNPLDNNYYCDNYNVYSEEVYVNLQAKKDFLFMCKSLTKDTFIQKEITEAFEEEYKEEIEKETKRYNNHIRDFTSRSDFNSYYLSFEEAFDLLVTDNPKWLEYPQIKLEYYIDENNKVQKRNVEQLLELLNNTNSQEEKEYINSLINSYKNAKNSKQF